MATKTETQINELKINYLTEEQYQTAVTNGEINANELYLTPDSGDSGEVAEHTHDEYMTVANPKGTGSLSVNRKAGSTIGDYSVATGYSCEASGNYSYAEGYSTTASGTYACAEGLSTTASGVAAHAEGTYTTALSYQHVQGHYNTSTSSGTLSGTTGTAFIIGNGTSSAASNAFRVQYNGGVYGKASYSSTGADYAEFFEWLDENPNDEDRRGYFVTLDGEKIKIAESNDYILGVVSGLPSVIGNGDEEWRGRYVMDEFGAYIYEDFEYEEEVHENVVDEETGEIKIVTKTVTKVGQKFKENPEYDPTLPYIQREDRPEWDAIGMIGVLSVRDDGTCQVNGYCKVTDGGIATASDTGYRVIKRVTDNIIKIIFR